jgi:hypothetical protein
MDHDIVVTTAQHGPSLYEILLLIVNLVGVVILGLYTYYTKKQKEISEKTLKQALEGNAIARAAQRAWLVPLEPVGADDSRFEVSYRNTGSAPAFNIVVKVNGSLSVDRTTTGRAYTTEKLPLSVWTISTAYSRCLGNGETGVPCPFDIVKERDFNPKGEPYCFEVDVTISYMDPLREIRTTKSRYIYSKPRGDGWTTIDVEMT